MRSGVPAGRFHRWAPVSAALAPVALVGGWTVAGRLQPDSYDPVRDTISALAARDAAVPGVMTAGLLVLGGCHLVTAAGLTEAERAGRLVLAAGGIATVLVAVFPQPSPGHVPAATAAFVALAAWPALTSVPGRRRAVAAAVTLTGLLAWLALEVRGGDLLGLSERVVAGAQALWPLAAVAAARLPSRSGRHPS